MASQIKMKPQRRGSVNGQGKQPINLSSQGTIMRESFTVNNKPLCSRMHAVQGLGALSKEQTLRWDSKTSPEMLRLMGHAFLSELSEACNLSGWTVWLAQRALRSSAAYFSGSTLDGFVLVSITRGHRFKQELYSCSVGRAFKQHLDIRARKLTTNGLFYTSTVSFPNTFKDSCNCVIWC